MLTNNKYFDFSKKNLILITLIQYLNVNINNNNNILFIEIFKNI